MINAKDALERMAMNSIDYVPMCNAVFTAIEQGSCSLEYYWKSPDMHNVFHNYLVNLGYQVWQFEDFILIQW